MGMSISYGPRSAPLHWVFPQVLLVMRSWTGPCGLLFKISTATRLASGDSKRAAVSSNMRSAWPSSQAVFKGGGMMIRKYIPWAIRRGPKSCAFQIILLQKTKHPWAAHSQYARTCAICRTCERVNVGTTLKTCLMTLGAWSA